MAAYVDAPADGRIVDLAKQTTSRLEVLWDKVGYTPEEKRRQMQGLIDGFQTLCENKVCMLLRTEPRSVGRYSSRPARDGLVHGRSKGSVVATRHTLVPLAD